MRELWLSGLTEGVPDPDAVTIQGVTRTGIPVKIGNRQEISFTVPKDAVLRVTVGVTAPEPERLTRGIVASIAPCSASEPTPMALASLRFSSPIAKSDWVDLELDLSEFAGRRLDLCLVASADDGTSPLPTDAVAWFGDPIVRSVGFRAPAGERPNLLIITLDTTRADHLSSAGYALPTTPNLDGLAAEPEAEQFLHAISVSPWTLPSHASLFTGLYPREHGARGDESGDIDRLWRLRGLKQDTVTLPERLAAVGYHGASVVGGPMVGAEFGFARGFDYYDQKGTDTLHDHNRRGVEITDLALQRLDREAWPFFLFLNYFDPHWPYEPPEDLAKIWVPADVQQISTEQQGAIWKDILNGQRDITDAEKRSMISHYDGSIASMDREIGRLLDGLKERGLYDSTMIVVVSDHGESFGEHRLVDHGHSLYEQVLRAALIIKYPKTDTPPHAKRNTQTVDLLDVHATICRAMGLTVPSNLALFGVHQRPHDHFAEHELNPFYVSRYGPRFDRTLEAVYRDRWKLIRDDKGNHWLFDLLEDPSEATNLEEALPDQVAILDEVLDEWSAHTAATRSVGPALNLTPQLRERLHALGYVGG